MKKNTTILVIVLLGLIVVVGGIVYKVVRAPKPMAPVAKEETLVDPIEPIDPAIQVSVRKSRVKANTVVVSVSGLGSKVASVAYELTYDSQGLIKGVNSGSKPIDTSGKDTFEREIYLGTCSRNVCKPDQGVKKVSVVLEFTNSSGKKSQFSKDFEL